MSNHSAVIMCDDLDSITGSGVFGGESPFNYYLPRITFQLAFLSLVTLAAQVMLKPLGQTRYVANLIAGVILGPSCLMSLAPQKLEFMFPAQGLPILDMALHLGLCFWYFLMGAQIHPGPMLKNVSAKAALIGMTSMVSPLLLSYPVFLIVNRIVPPSMQSGVTPWFLGIYFLPTTITVLAGNVIDHQLLGTDAGNLVMSAAIFTSVAAILPLNVLLILVSPRQQEDVFYVFPLAKLLSGLGFAAFSFFVARPVINWVARRIPNEEDVRETHVSALLLWAVMSAAITEALGSRITYGAFIAGFILPHSALTTVVTKRLEDFNTTVLMPPFFAVVGLHTHVPVLFSSGKGMTLVIMLVLIFLGKIGMIAMVASSGRNVNMNEGWMIGMLMSSRGIIDILLVFWASTRGISRTGDQEFTILILGIIMVNMLIGPAISFLYDRPRLLLHKGCRSVQELRPDSELRIIACLYDQHTIPSILSLINATNATKSSPIYLSVMHLIHATSRESAVQQQSLETGGFVRGSDAVSLNAAFRMHKWPAWVDFSLHTKLSSYSTMPEHVCNAAESGRATIVIIPFHIKRLLGSHTGVSNDIVRNINLSVLEKSPCSVGVLVDMGVVGTRANVFYNVALLFFGGSHDREALSYASRMAELETLRLTLVRFVLAPDAAKAPLPINHMTEDDICISRFRSMSEGRRTITYLEKMIGCGADTVTVIQGMDKTHDLFIVGRNHKGAAAKMLSGLDTWSEYPELGTLGDLLVSPDISAPAVLVVQQYSWGDDVEEEGGSDGMSCGGQTYRGYVLHDQVRASAPLPARGSDFIGRPGSQPVQFDEYGWNWNLRAGF